MLYALIGNNSNELEYSKIAFYIYCNVKYLFALIILLNSLFAVISLYALFLYIL